MRAKTAAVFAFGFAVGIFCMSIGLWRAGALRTRESTRYGHPQPASVPEGGKERLPGPPATLWKPAPPAPSASEQQPTQSPQRTQGEAERQQAPELGQAPHLAMPISRMDPNSLADTFNQDRNGHKHEALDIPAPRGTPVIAVDEGNVVKLFTSKQGGLTVYQFNDSGTYCYYYAHLDRYAPGLKEGVLLRKGDVLGYVGSTGNASEAVPHLHFAVFKLGPEKKWWEGTAIDPLPLLR